MINNETINQYFYEIEYYDDFESPPILKTIRGLVSATSYTNAMAHLEKYYYDILSVNKLYPLDINEVIDFEILKDTINDIKKENEEVF